MSDEPRLTPMMQRYLEVKRAHPEAILLFRMGDFYELFYEDAETAARVLGLTLTSRDKGSTNPVPMAGFPYHQLDNYLRRLIQAGFRASVCEQVEDPKLAKGLVRREVTRVVTPGTLTDDALLDPKEQNYLASLGFARQTLGLAWLELSTGEFFTAEIPPSALADELARLQPAELLVAEASRGDPRLLAAEPAGGLIVTPRPDWSFHIERARRTLLEHFATATLSGFDLDFADDSPAVAAAGALLDYVQETQRCQLGYVVQLLPYRPGTHLVIDEASRRSLELTRTLRSGTREGSLLGAIDETVTAMGARLLAAWLADPLTDAAAIEARLEAVAEFARDAELAGDVRKLLREARDLQRLTARVATGRATPRDLDSLAATLRLLPKLKARLAGRRAARLQELESQLDLCGEIRARIEELLTDDPPLSAADGNVIRDGCDPRLDELRDLARGGKEWIARYQAQEAQRLGIPSLKVGFNRVFGYYLEVTAANAARIPPEYIRKQTLKNQERFITPELKQHEDRVLRAEEQSKQLELELFTALRTQAAEYGVRLQRTAAAMAELDVVSALGTLAVQANYCRPEIVAEPVLDVREGRHPVLDRLQPGGTFVPNDVRLGGDAGTIQLITGPNMAGKSTYIRQAALIAILAQIGSFVPARSARVGIVDRVFARVGASDELGRGQSTFMVEMIETARILNAATPRSLVILDEIGRGTSTYDGISLAWSVTEFLHDAVGCRTLFATHYHELTELSSTLPNLRNWNVAVREEQGRVVFLHRIVAGAADKSYGIHVARLAGVPADVLGRAEVILKTLEQDHLDPRGELKIPPRPKMTRPRGRDRQKKLFEE